MIEFIKALMRWLVGVVIAVAVTLGLFLVLPIMQAIGQKDDDQIIAQEVNVIVTETPPDVPEDDPPEEEKPEEIKEPELTEEPLVADITQLDLALNGIGGVGIPAADMTINIDSFVDKGELDDAFSFEDLDEKARVIYQEAPKMNDALRKRTPATVVVVLIVDARGRVSNAVAQSSSDRAFERIAVNAVKKWRFEPAKSRGKPVESRLRVPITFPKD